jgi:phage terminase large subunit-like protein
MPKRKPSKPSPKPRSQKPNSARIVGLRNKAKREGWLKFIRQGEGEEADELAMLNGCYFNPRRAEHWLTFADDFGTLTEGAWRGQKFRLLDWQANDTSTLLGWCKFSEEWGGEIRRFRMWYEEVPKKNGKTPLLSLLGNYLLFADCVGWDGVARQISLYLAATTRKQAEKTITHAVRQIRDSDILNAEAKITIKEGFKHIEYNSNTWEVIAADPASADGVNGHCLAEEFHRWKGFEFYNTLKWMLATQPEGLFLAITTAGEDGENVCKYTHDYTIDVNCGRVHDEQFLGKIYAASNEDDLSTIETWKKANPSLGDTRDAPLKISTFKADYQTAKADPTQWTQFKRLRLGIWATGTHNWIDAATKRGIDDWDSGPTMRSRSKSRIDCFQLYDDQFLRSIDAVSKTLAFDLAAIRDTVAAVLSIEDPEGIVWTRSWFWLPEDEAANQSKYISYQRWAQDGFIRLMPGEVIDYKKITHDLIDIIEGFAVEQFYYDPYTAEGLTQDLDAATQAERIEFPQTVMSYGPCVAELERRIQSKTIRHNGNQVLTWQIKNAIARENDNGFKRLVKRTKGERKKVDGAQALAMSLQNVVSGNTTDNSDDDDPFVLE